MADRPKRDLIVLSCTEIRRGGGGEKREWFLYNVVATTPEGEPVEKELRTFSKLEITGKPQTFEVEAGEFRGTPQYTLHPVYTMKLPERVEAVERRLLEVEERLARLESPASETGEVPAASPAGPAGDPNAW